MKADILIHESFEVADKENRTPVVLLHDVFECTESEFDKIRSDYESRSGKYGMNNSSLDHCWYW